MGVQTKPKVVREALEEISKMAFHGSISRARYWYALSIDATDDELIKLASLLKI
jgi:hypothetical protein